MRIIVIMIQEKNEFSFDSFDPKHRIGGIHL